MAWTPLKVSTSLLQSAQAHHLSRFSDKGSNIAAGGFTLLSEQEFRCELRNSTAEDPHGKGEEPQSLQARLLIQGEASNPECARVRVPLVCQSQGPCWDARSIELDTARTAVVCGVSWAMLTAQGSWHATI